MSRINTVRYDDNEDIEPGGEVSAEDQRRINAAFARGPAIEAAIATAKGGPRWATPAEQVRAAQVAAGYDAMRAARTAEVLAASTRSIAEANARELRADEGNGTPTDKLLVNQTKTDAAKKDENGTADVLARILEAITGLTARMDSLEASNKKKPADNAKCDNGEDNGNGDGGIGEEKHEGDDPEKPKRVVADSDAISEWRAERLEPVLGAHGLDSVRPLQGETLKAYQLRALGKLKRFSPKFKDVDLASLNGPAYSAVIGVVLDEALAAGMRGPEVQEGAGLVEVRRPDRSGRIISTFHGDGKHTFIREMSRAPRFVKSFSVPSQNAGA